MKFSEVTRLLLRTAWVGSTTSQSLQGSPAYLYDVQVAISLQSNQFMAALGAITRLFCCF